MHITDDVRFCDAHGMLIVIYRKEGRSISHVNNESFVSVVESLKLTVDIRD